MFKQLLDALRSLAAKTQTPKTPTAKTPHNSWTRAASNSSSSISKSLAPSLFPPASPMTPRSASSFNGGTPFAEVKPVNRRLFGSTPGTETRALTEKKFVSTLTSFESNGENRAYYIKIAATENSDPVTLCREMKQRINAHPDSILIMFVRSKIMVWDKKLGSFAYIKNEEVLQKITPEAIQAEKLAPHGGHVFLTVTDHTGSSEFQSNIRPAERVDPKLEGKSALHPHLYDKTSLPTSLFIGKNVPLDIELTNTANDMIKNNDVHFEIIAIPKQHSQITVDQLQKNIEEFEALQSSTEAKRIYNLCSAIFNNSDLEKITDAQFKEQITKLTQAAQDIPELKYLANAPGGYSVLAGFACTHLTVHTITGDPHYLEKELGPDLATHAVAVYCTILLLGDASFLQFAKEHYLLDNTADVTISRRPGQHS